MGDDREGIGTRPGEDSSAGRAATLAGVMPGTVRGPDADGGVRVRDALARHGAGGALVALGERLGTASPFLAHALAGAGEAQGEAAWLASQGERDPQGAIADLIAEIDALSPDEDPAQAAAMDALRLTRLRAAVLVAFADTGRLWGLDPVIHALSDVADAHSRAAWRLGVAHALRRRRLPEGGDPERGGFVLALGKLGTRSLNYSSDIDLVCFYDPSRMPDLSNAGSSGASFGEGFIEAAKRFTHLLAAPVAGRIAHRVDWRLRPDPGATPLAISTDAALVYYQTQARSWERLAFIKARPVAGDMEAARDFLAELEPFVWRRSLDFGLPAEMRAMAARIRAHHGQEDGVDGAGGALPPGWNVKTGRGGIREIEFLAQSHQTVLGGRDASLRHPATRPALAALARRGVIEKGTAGALDEAYVHHRTLEHRLQMIADRQTQTMPTEGGDLARLAALMDPGPTVSSEGPAAVAAVKAHAQRMRAIVSDAFDAMMPGGDGPADRDGPPSSDAGAAVASTARSGEGPDEGAERLAAARQVLRALDAPPEANGELTGAMGRLGFTDAPSSARILTGWLAARPPALRGPRARPALEALLPAMLADMGARRDPDRVLASIDRTLSRMSSGVQLGAMLEARPAIASLLVRLADEAPALADDLSRDPGLLTQIADPSFWDRPERGEIAARLRDLERATGGLEAAMDAARIVHRTEMFRLAMRILEHGDGPKAAAEEGNAAGRIGEDITLVVEACVAHLWRASLADRGVPDAPMALLALGRLGARETTLLSDLDLIVLTGEPDAEGRYARAVRTFLAAVGSPTGEGRFREVDMRLRPSGRAGPLVTTLEAFARHHETAEAWELIALGRARPVAGPGVLCGEVADALAAIRAAPRDRAVIAANADEVLERVRAERPPRGPLDVKNLPGGLFDIEFALHRAALLAPEKVRERAARETGTAALAEALASGGSLPRAALEDARDVHETLTVILHKLAVTLGQNAARAAPDDLPEGLGRGERGEPLGDEIANLCARGTAAVETLRRLDQAGVPSAGETDPMPHG